MVFVCKICQDCPNSHSLIKFEENKERIIYYTCPKKALDNRIEGILYHYDGVLSEIKDKDWIWILDLNEYGIKEMLEINNTIAIVSLIKEKYSKTLQKIIVINTNSYTQTLYNVIKPFLNKRMKEIVYFSKEKWEHSGVKNQILQI